MMVRCFIVGCPRSGTTLLQAMLAANSKVVALPESHFFRKSFMGRRAFIFRGLRASRALRDWLDRIGLSHCTDELPRFSLARQPVVNAFMRIMDDLARKNGSTCWVEKTPGHIFAIDEIERNIPDARFIHMIRDGRAVVASLYDASRRYPEVWKQRSLQDFIELWNRAVTSSVRYEDKPNHLIVRYEGLVSEPVKVLQAVCEFLSLEYEDSMLKSYREAAHKVMLQGQDWIKGAAEPLKARTLEKYYTLLSESERQYVEENLLSTGFEEAS